jgi:hypothetical protein
MAINSISQIEGIYIFVATTKDLTQPGMEKSLIKYGAESLATQHPIILQALKSNLPLHIGVKTVNQVGKFSDEFFKWLEQEFSISQKDGHDKKIGVFSGDAKDPSTGFSFTWGTLFYLKGK